MSRLSKQLPDVNNDYDIIARYYDYAAGWSLNPARRELARMAVELGAGRVLDIGCGTGLQLAEFKRNGLEAVGVDNSAAMLKVAGQRLAREGLPGEESDLVLSSGGSLPFAAASFDLAVISLMLHESEEEPELILDEALRVAPRLFVLDWTMAERNLDYPVRLGVNFIERLAGRRHYAAYKRYMRAGAIEGLMLRYGLQRSVTITRRKHLVLNSMLLMQIDKQ